MESRVEAFVLAGGHSSRFGSNKALALFRGKPLLVRALDAVREAGLANPRVVCRDPDPYRGWATAFVLSERPGRGPAEAARAALASSAAPWVLLLAADMPEVDGALLRLLLRVGLQRADPGDPGTEPRAGRLEQGRSRREPASAGDRPRHLAVCFEAPPGRRHPLPGLYHRLLLERFPRLGEAPSLHRLLEEARALVLGPDAVGEGAVLERSLRNVNRPEDLPPAPRS